MAATLTAALDALLAARLAEGAAVKPVLTGLVGKITALVDAAETQSQA